MRPGQPPTSLGTLPSQTPTQPTKQKSAGTQATMHCLDLTINRNITDARESMESQTRNEGDRRSSATKRDLFYK
ncbi:hypothetical protein ALC60_11332 [Trachymyrmex zeteki]|uniref:Uncharacterized protein n=1 Tax=Mycetomoellerius zeteki TaxID=64791 RepID=A0A151WP07_9HYME|nr:hypothetical protein ALC60_11332 [Trachymyrmex zeteki]